MSEADRLKNMVVDNQLLSAGRMWAADVPEKPRIVYSKIQDPTKWGGDFKAIRCGHPLIARALAWFLRVFAGWKQVKV